MPIEIRDGDNLEKHLKANGAGTAGDPYVPVHAIEGSLPLPAGAATAAAQSTGNTSLAAIQAAVEGVMDVAVTGNVTVAEPVTVEGMVNVGALPDVTVGAIALPTIPRIGRVTVATGGTAVQFPAGVLLSGVNVKALAANAGIVEVVLSGGAVGSGFELAAGESVFVEAANLNALYVNAATAGWGVGYVGS